VAFWLVFADWMASYYDSRACDAGTAPVWAVIVLGSVVLPIAGTALAIPAKKHPVWLALGTLLAIFVGFSGVLFASIGGDYAGGCGGI